YLDIVKSVCSGCARGCNIDVHVNRRRSHHGEGRRVARFKPRFNAEVNKWWICDDGRYGYRFVDDDDRVKFPARREHDTLVELTWGEAVADLAEVLKRHRPDEVAVIASPKMSNE